MEKFIYFYQHLPIYIDPTAFSIGFFSISWYSIMYLIGFGVIYILLKYRIRRGEYKIKNIKIIWDLLLYCFSGLLIGARLGYVIFYNFSFYWSHPLNIISPIDPITHQFIGIYGMSYHGGVIGIIITALIFAKIYKINFLNLANFVAPAIPAGYFFGRLGNFINGELYGRVTGKIWGMYFPFDTLVLLRHPSQLYEAFFEGLVLFLILWKIRNNKKYKNHLLGVYFLGYTIFRIGIEFFREPDEQIGFIFGFLTLGQILSLAMFFLGISLIFYKNNQKLS